ncbi:MAG: serine hydrolase [Alphaproteobacteria bacterium]|nr:serine hydrolase [Alphaproteobacteria bacterium]
MRVRFYHIIGLLIACMPYVSMAAPYRAVLVADMDTGRVLYQENANDINYPASLTKIMTLYLTFDALEHGRLHLDDYLIVSNSAASASPVKLGLAAGSKITVEDAIKAVAVISANDVARVLAENLKGGKEGNFADLMTRVATEIGLSRTHFENSSGLPNDDHTSTARDIALLSIAVYRHFPQYWKYFGIKTWTYNGKTYTNGNRLLGTYPGCDGMKTGFTNKSKYSLVATVSRNGRHLMSVVLGAENKDIRANVSTNMLNKGFAMVANLPPVATPSAPAQPTTTPVAQPTIAQSYQAATAAAQPMNTVNTSGGAGVQFGAFSSHEAAQTQVQNVKNKLGATATIEQSGGLYRVRTNGLSETAAQNLKSAATNAGIDSYVFH